ncbi:MAG: right-handed parallel beta-helix repeat-containing protein [Bacteroidales bacterium]|nr:right-handed parallel beta-helix repeat-containing protein [Bacteroidales bacterium]
MKRLLIIATTFLLGILAMNSCIKEYTITVGTNNAEWGSVTGSGTYVANSEVVISAIPASGYYFIKWDDGNTDNPRTILVTGDKAYQAIFSNNPNGGGQGGGNGTSMNISDNISENTTWPDLGLDVDYIVDGWINIEGNALLTIEPGVTIMFTGENGGMTVHENAGLKMVGTADKPIKFVGPLNNPNNGSWGRVEIHSKRNDNVWEYVQFLRGGSSDYVWDGVIDVYDAKLAMRNCTIDGSLGYGLVMEYGTRLTAFEGNTIKNCAQYPIVAEYWVNLLDLNANNTFISNGHNFIDARCRDISMENHTTIKAMPIPYCLEYGLHFDGGYKLTIEPGTQFYIRPGQNIDMDENSTFIADGTAEKPIIFRGVEDEDSYWIGIKYHSTKQASVMNYCTVINCGEDTEGFHGGCICIYNNSRLTLTNCTIGKSLHYGITLDDVELMGRISHSNNTFTNCAGGNVWLESGGDYNGTHYDDGQILDDLPE